MNGDDFFFLTVARGPVPRDLSTAAENAGSPETTDVCCSDRCMARDRPSPYGESGHQAWRGEPARMRVWHPRAQPYVKGRRFFTVARGLSSRRCAIPETPQSPYCALLILPQVVAIFPAASTSNAPSMPSPSFWTSSSESATLKTTTSSMIPSH